jgi:HK97 gp10 family phage protein
MAAVATVEIQRSGPDGTEHYAIFQEFGTSKMPAQPFFRTGIEAAKPQITTVMGQALWAALKKHAD